MDVLFLAQRVPYPPDRGDRITTWHFVRHYAERGDRVRIGAFAESARDREAAAELARRVGAEVCAVPISRRWRRLASLRGLLSGQALTLPFFWSGRLARQVSQWAAAAPPDLVHVYSSSMAQYALGLRGARRLMQFAELDSDKWAQFAAARRGVARWIYAREAARLLRFERRVAHEFDWSCVVSEAERELFRQRIPDVDPQVLPNGVDVEQFASRGDAQRDPHAVVFTGVMDYEPNVDGVLWFVRECWPAVRARVPDARLFVVGSQPVAAIRNLARDDIVVTGRVAATPEWFDRAAVAIAPLRLARGVQNKVLEALSMGLPVVATSPAARGLGATPGEFLRSADGAQEFAGAVAALLQDPARARSLGLAAAAYVRAHWRWEDVFRRLDALLARP